MRWKVDRLLLEQNEKWKDSYDYLSSFEIKL
jgi:hypothetical protein